MQSSIPVITALAGAFLIGEEITIRLLLSSVAIIGGMALVIANKPLKS